MILAKLARNATAWCRNSWSLTGRYSFKAKYKCQGGETSVRLEMRKLPASKCLASEPTAACYTNKNRPVHCQNLASLIFLLQRRTSQSICGRKVGEIPFRARRCSCFAWLTSMFDNEKGYFVAMFSLMARKPLSQASL